MEGQNTFTEDGNFVQSDRFEQIWVSEHKNDNYNATDILTDSEYIDYKLWDDMNWRKLYKKHLPDVMVSRGENPNIIFHGGCLGCLSQRLHGLERCIGCMFFRFSGGKKDNLRIKGEESAKMSSDDLNNLLNPPKN